MDLIQTKFDLWKTKVLEKEGVKGELIVRTRILTLESFCDPDNYT